MINNRRLRDNYMPNEGACIPQEMVIDNVRLAAGYVPYQFMCELFNPLEALAKGTAFPELYSPYDRKDKRDKAYRMSENG
ncbi:MAG: spore coat associated protein CotJA [Sedimentibacter sp.]